MVIICANMFLTSFIANLNFLDVRIVQNCPSDVEEFYHHLSYVSTISCLCLCTSSIEAGNFEAVQAEAVKVGWANSSSFFCSNIAAASREPVVLILRSGRVRRPKKV